VAGIWHSYVYRLFQVVIAIVIYLAFHKIHTDMETVKREKKEEEKKTHV
jgi:cellobiose-specific phosphotransferase system component IIC